MKPWILSCAVSLYVAGGAILPAQTTTEIEYLHPFSHLAHIPANSDTASIRFTGIKLVRVATEIKFIENKDYCNEAAHAPDPGGSMFCPEVEPAAFEPAYQLTYSYTGPPLSSDEHGNTNYTFGIYVRPSELDEQQRQELKKTKSAAAERYLDLTTSRETQRRIVIDEAASSFCEGTYMDGAWTVNDPQCTDVVKFRLIRWPSDYLTVGLRVLPPSSPRSQQ